MQYAASWKLEDLYRGLLVESYVVLRRPLSVESSAPCHAAAPGGSKSYYLYYESSTIT